MKLYQLLLSCIYNNEFQIVPYLNVASNKEEAKINGIEYLADRLPEAIQFTVEQINEVPEEYIKYVAAKVLVKDEHRLFHFDEFSGESTPIVEIKIKKVNLKIGNKKIVQQSLIKYVFISKRLLLVIRSLIF